MRLVQVITEFCFDNFLSIEFLIEDYEVFLAVSARIINLSLAMMEILQKLKFNSDGLIPAIAQDINTKEVLMMAWMNEESIKATLESGYATYFSRSRNQLWKKGDTSEHLQKLVSISTDCDFDCILLQVIQTGAACHTGEKTCFFNKITQE